MLHKEIEEFRETVASPAMQKILENTKIPEGLCCVNKVEISYLDGRSCGTDSIFQASGFLYRNGNVEEYSYNNIDGTMEEFVQAHKDVLFISDGKIHVFDELEELEISATLRSTITLAKIFPEFEQLNSLKFEFLSLEWVKMQLLFQENIENKKDIDLLISEGKDEIVSLNCDRTVSKENKMGR